MERRLIRLFLNGYSADSNVFRLEFLIQKLRSASVTPNRGDENSGTEVEEFRRRSVSAMPRKGQKQDLSPDRFLIPTYKRQAMLLPNEAEALPLRNIEEAHLFLSS